MRRIIEVSVPQDEAITELIAEGKYRDAQHFHSSAIDTQLLIEAGDAGSVYAQSQGGVSEPRPHHGDSGVSRATPTLGEIRTLSPLPSSRVEGGNDPNRWLWGQVNSVLGMKFACREAAHCVGERLMPLKELVSQIATEAASFGDYLRSLDKQYERGRGAMLSVSFPTLAAARKDKSIDRFGFHYVGYRRMDGKYDGALFQLGLLSVDQDGNPGLTEVGARFAALANPVIDREIPPTWLSTEEQHFYLHEIAAHQPMERLPISWMLEAVASGDDDRMKINRRLSDDYGDWSDAEVETFRVGTLSRMVQLGVLAVSRDGRDFNYSLGPNASLVPNVSGRQRGR